MYVLVIVLSSPNHLAEPSYDHLKSDTSTVNACYFGSPGLDGDDL
jgi:hypothetical protein